MRSTRCGDLHIVMQLVQRCEEGRALAALEIEVHDRVTGLHQMQEQ
jgi:hypothetical protein